MSWGAPPVARRAVVDIAKCDVCHSVVAEHGANRNNNAQVCVACHSPASTDVGMRQTLTTAGTDGLWEQTIDFKHMIHAIHDGSVRGAAGSPFVIYGFGGSENNFTDVVYPGQLNRCDACHVGTSYYPVVDTAVQATTFLTGLSKQTPESDDRRPSHCDISQHGGLLGLPCRCPDANSHAAKRRLEHGYEGCGRSNHPEYQPRQRGDVRDLSRCGRRGGCEGSAPHPHHGELNAAAGACGHSRRGITPLRRGYVRLLRGRASAPGFPVQRARRRYLPGLPQRCRRHRHISDQACTPR